MIAYANTEQTVKLWLIGTSVAALVTRPDGGISIYNAMPTGAPVPSIILRQISGGPSPHKDIPEQQTRIQIDVWGDTRNQAADIALQILTELDQLVRSVGPIINGVYLAATSAPSMRWLPDPDSDTPRYIIDVLVTTVA